MIREARVNGIRLVYREEGDPAAPPMVLLHGRTANHNDWNGVLRHFTGRYHVIAPDMRGHGESDYPGSYAFPDMARDIVALMDELGFERVTLIGHSLGGLVAYHLAMACPGRVERLVLEEPAPPTPLTGRPPIVETDAKGFDWRMVHESERQFLAPDPAWADGLARITAPTLVLFGRTSHLEMGVVAELIPGAETATLEAGHLVHADAKEQFTRVVDDFLAGSRPVGTGDPG
ncbi:alpha/beta fold hydrolase [Nonomuraea rhizosphaerae]|uniref:alpha/beta fold hydrolase n=1 Tax=Nonomuraea rhizosphaerae TaxID=2665663 RepID=UPI001C5F3831|nr:alpha/beta hydrolase [Nonomuraea rhizosphaerae]